MKSIASTAPPIDHTRPSELAGSAASLLHSDRALPAARKRSPPQPQPIHAASLPDALLRLQTVSAVAGLSAATIYRKVASGEFPQPVRLGLRCTRWKSGCVQSWLAAQTAGTLRRK